MAGKPYAFETLVQYRLELQRAKHRAGTGEGGYFEEVTFGVKAKLAGLERLLPEGPIAVVVIPCDGQGWPSDTAVAASLRRSLDRWCPKSLTWSDWIGQTFIGRFAAADHDGKNSVVELRL